MESEKCLRDVPEIAWCEPLKFDFQKERELMKKITCRQLGRPCDFVHQGKAPDEVIKAQDRHLKEIVDGGDEAHQVALREMKSRWKNPIAGLAWCRKAKKDFAALPEI